MAPNMTDSPRNLQHLSLAATSASVQLQCGAAYENISDRRVEKGEDEGNTSRKRRLLLHKVAMANRMMSSTDS